MESTCAISVGVVVARERIDNPWQEYIWRPVGVFMDEPELEDWRQSHSGEGIQYHAATVSIELHRKDTDSYRVNLESGEPAVYVVVREDPGADVPMSVPCVTVSPYDSQVYLESGLETVHQVPMPAPLMALVREFVAVHHVDEPFIKRQRQKHTQKDEHKFGQEPIFVLRERTRATNGGGGSQ